MEMTAEKQKNRRLGPSNAVLSEPPGFVPSGVQSFLGSDSLGLTPPIPAKLSSSLSKESVSSVPSISLSNEQPASVEVAVPGFPFDFQATLSPTTGFDFDLGLNPPILAQPSSPSKKSGPSIASSKGLPSPIGVPGFLFDLPTTLPPTPGFKFDVGTGSTPKK